MEMLLLKQHLTPILWDDLSETIAWYQDNERWADEAIRQMQERGFSYSEGGIPVGIITRFSHERLTEVAGALERPLAIARTIAAVLNHAHGTDLISRRMWPDE